MMLKSMTTLAFAAACLTRAAGDPRPLRRSMAPAASS